MLNGDDRHLAVGEGDVKLIDELHEALNIVFTVNYNKGVGASIGVNEPVRRNKL